MASKFSNSAATLALGMAFIVTPALLNTAGPIAIDKAFAAQGGNGNGNGGGNGGGNGNGGSGNTSNSHGNGNQVAATDTETTTETETKVKHGAIASQLGALNAAHASAQAFAHPSPNSRIGKIKSYYLANQEFLTAQIAADAEDALVLQTAFNISAPIAVVDAYEALQANPDDPDMQAAYDLAVATEALMPEQVTALETAYTDWQKAVEADALAAAAEAAAQEALNLAANKTTPLSDEAKAALDDLLVGKIN